MPDLKSCLEKRVTFCGQADETFAQRGRYAELRVVEYLCQNLPDKAGDYRILVNYNQPVRDGGPAAVYELDIVVIARQGVFILEVKDWHGIVDAYDDRWLQSRSHSRPDQFELGERKARTFRSEWFAPASKLGRLGAVNCTSLIVLYQGKANFFNHSRYNEQKVVDVSGELVYAIAERDAPWNRNANSLSDQQIQLVRDAIYTDHVPGQPRRIGPYRIVTPMSPGRGLEAFEAFEAVRTSPNRRVRVKCYQFDYVAGITEADIRRAQRSANANWGMGVHPNIVQTFDFLPDDHQPNVFYEITEFLDGSRLDEIMRKVSAPLTFAQQLTYVEPICAALDHAHRNDTYHRNVNPEVVFVTEHGHVKLADFDLAKIANHATITLGTTEGRRPLVWNAMTAPEVRKNPSWAGPASDIYSLGVLWYYLSILPRQKEYINTELNLQPAQIDELPLSPDARALMWRMVHPDANERPQSAQTVLESFASIKRSAHSM